MPVPSTESNNSPKPEPGSAPPPTPYTVFQNGQIRSIVALCALAGFFSPFSAFTYFPTLEYMTADLGVSLQMMNLTITMFIVVQGIIPAVLGDVADQIGRRPVYLLVLIVYFLACIGLALQRSYPALLVLRMLQSAGSSGTIALGIMVVANLAPPHSRSRYVGAMLSGPNCGPSLGPVIGGVLAERAGWPWIFWLLAILGGFCFAVCLVLLPETCRNVVGNGAYTARGRFNRALVNTLSPRTHKGSPDGGVNLSHNLRRCPNPFTCLKILVRRHDALLLTSNSLFYATYSCFHAGLAPLVMSRYGLNALQAGLCYLAYGVATISSLYLVGKTVMDFDYRATARSCGITINVVSGDDIASFPIERARIRSLGYFIVVGIAATLGFGWAIERHAHLSVPLVMLFVCGVTYTAIFNTCLTLNVDLHPTGTGLASVAASLMRCVAAAVGVAILQPMLDAVGPGWTFTFFACLSGLSVPMLLILRILGPSWRKCSSVNRELGSES
ncbi:putative major facilitator superfamily transporter [Coniochaeta sp. 2T2.1]|nr:putative major facilitator superfamily transporter [Coniochaeta sp. 2T2.1]